MKKTIVGFAFTLISFLILFTNCQPSSSSGEVLYTNNCANCHMADGKGVGTLYPDLNKSAYLKMGSVEIACFIQNGITAPNLETARFETYNMPPSKHLSSVDITNIMNYIQKEFNGGAVTYNHQTVKETLKECNL